MYVFGIDHNEMVFLYIIVQMMISIFIVCRQMLFLLLSDRLGVTEVYCALEKMTCFVVEISNQIFTHDLQLTAKWKNLL
jgi:hypothetical protein